nr:unnamed protein product [Digitaria exilis]
MDYPEWKSLPPRHVLLFMYGVLIFLSSNNATFSSAQTTNRSEADRQALLCFKSGISGDPGGVLGSWREDSLDFCSWRGVNCSTTLPIRVVSLELRSAKIKGQLSSCMVNLTSLVRIDLSSNDLSGSIPEEIGALPSLETLILDTNRFSGNIPRSLGTAASLRNVNLGRNALSGVIPVSLAKVPSLRVLVLSMNNLSGEIPVVLFNNASNLVTVDLQDNSLSGGKTTQPSESYRETMKKVSYGDILKATNWFSPVNKISSSHTASVYIGRFEYDTDLVAIKPSNILLDYDMTSRIGDFGLAKFLSSSLSSNPEGLSMGWDAKSQPVVMFMVLGCYY